MVRENNTSSSKESREKEQRPSTTPHKSSDNTQQASTRPSRESDVFYEEVLFPDPHVVFTFQPDTIADINQSAVIVLDASALLLPYTDKLERQSLEDIERIYKLLITAKRLIIPAQAAREFARHRSSKVAEMYSAVARRLGSFPSTKGEAFPLWESVEVYDRMTGLQRELSEKISQYKKSIDDMLDYLQNWNGNDPISQLYRKLFTSNIVFKPEVDKEKLLKDLDWRKANRIPPGYLDSTANEKKIGDLLIWHTILQIGRERQRHVIFVSGDVKADWRVRVAKGADAENDLGKEAIRGTKPLYPRYELVEEFRRESGGYTFQMLQLHELLALHGASQTTVEDVKQVEATAEIEEARAQDSTQDPTLYSDLGNARLRQAALDLVSHLRELIDKEAQEEGKLKQAYADAIQMRHDKDERDPTYNRYIDEANELRQSTQREYNRRFKVEARLLRDEMLTRAVGNVVREEDVNRWYDNGGSGFILEHIATDLEYVARHLPA